MLTRAFLYIPASQTILMFLYHLVMLVAGYMSGRQIAGHVIFTFGYLVAIPSALAGDYRLHQTVDAWALRLSR